MESRHLENKPLGHFLDALGYLLFVSGLLGALFTVLRRSLRASGLTCSSIDLLLSGRCTVKGIADAFFDPARRSLSWFARENDAARPSTAERRSYVLTRGEKNLPRSILEAKRNTLQICQEAGALFANISSRPPPLANLRAPRPPPTLAAGFPLSQPSRSPTLVMPPTPAATWHA